MSRGEKEELKRYLKENLRLEIFKIGGDCDLLLIIDGEIISKIPIFCDVKIRGIWGQPFNAEKFFVKIDEEL